MSKPPFRADEVGSLLRPPRIKEARAKREKGEIDEAALRAIEDEEIAKVVQKQKDVGLMLATDGEFRRSFWHFDFLAKLSGVELYHPETGIQFQGVQTKNDSIRVIGKIDFPADHPMLAHFKYLNAQCQKTGTVAKMTIPAPSVLHFRGGRKGITETVYPDLAAFFDDTAKAYRKAVAAFYAAGCRYLQFDDTVWAYLCSAEEIEKAMARGDDTANLQKIYAQMINYAIAEKPADMTITTHVCRGNFRSTWISSGGYEPVAETLLAGTNYDGYFLEYDSDRAGGFEPLRFLPKGNKIVVAGLVTSKSGDLESKDLLKRRLDEAAKFAPIAQLALSPQCGFASTEEGNVLTEAAQWDKLRLVVDLANEIWVVPEAPRVSAIVVSYHTGAPLEDCLGRLEADLAVLDVIVVDNGNPPEIVAALQARAARTPKVRLITGHGNVGFSRGCNLGAANAQGDYFAFINPDVRIEPGCLEALCAAADGARKPVIVGARILWPDGREQRGGRRDLITPWRAFVTAFGLGRFEKVSPLFRDLHREGDPVSTAPLRVGSVSGAAMLAPRASFETLGGFDEKYFLHVEDADLCRRAAEAGGETLFAPAAHALHHRSTSETTSFKVERAKAASFARYFFKFARNPADFFAACIVTPPLALGLIARGFLRDMRGGKGAGAEARMFFLFALVGAIAFVVDSLVLKFCLAQGLSGVIGRVISLFVSMNFTFAVNRAFVFTHFRAAPLSQQWMLYLAANALGALVNYAVYLALTAPSALLAGRDVLAVACGSIAGLAFNFTASRLTAFRR